MSEFRLIGQRLGLVALTNVIVSLSGLILLPILTKNLSIEDYGLWILFNATITLVPNVVLLGLPFSLIRFLSPLSERKEIAEVFYSLSFVVGILSILVSTAIFLLSEVIGNLLFPGMMVLVTYFSIIIFFECMNNQFFSFFRALQKIKIYSFFSIFKIILSICLICFFILQGQGIIGAVIALGITNAVLSLLMMVGIVHLIGLQIPTFHDLTSFLMYGIPTISANVSYWLMQSIDRYFIGLFLGLSFVGYYSPGYSLGNILLFFTAPFALILPSVLPQLYHLEKYEDIRKILQFSIKYFCLLSIPSIFGLTILSQSLLNILTTPAISQQGYVVTPLILISCFFFGLYTIVSQILFLTKKTQVIGIVWMVSAGINIITNVVFIHYFGILGAGISAIASFFILFLVISIFSSRYLKIEYNIAYIWKYLVGAVMMSIILLILHPTTTPAVILSVISCSGFYLTMVYLLKGIDQNEISFFTRLVYNPK